MTVRTYTPKLQVLLTKVVDRQAGVAARYTAAPRQIDLTPYLGVAGSVQTAKDLSSPAGGFSISFADQPDSKFGDTLYALIEPMDMIEIRAARQPERYTGQPLPLIMRGYVSAVERTEAMGAGGVPQRLVVVSGQDSGKLWLINRVYFNVALLENAPMLSAFHLQVAIGINVAVMSISEFVTTITNQVMNAKVASLAAAAGHEIQPFVVDSTVTEGSIIPQLIANMDAVPVWSLVSQFADRPWNELFIQDHEDGPHVVFRPVPYKDITGALISPQATDPGAVVVDIADVVALRLMRSDARIANFFWVPPGASIITTNGMLSVAALDRGESTDFSHANNQPGIYGTRMMQAATELTPTNLAAVPAMLPAGDRVATIGTFPLWFEARMSLLKLMNRDNGVFEEGAATIKGSEQIVPGKYLTITRGSLVSTAYVERVAHNFTPMQTWTTDVVLVRGDGFLARSKMAGAPYFAEGRSGPYTRPGAA